jgi:hypothetical protein
MQHDADPVRHAGRFVPPCNVHEPSPTLDIRPFDDEEEERLWIEIAESRMRLR